MSKTTQDDLLSCMADHLLANIITEVKYSRFSDAQADEVSDLSAGMGTVWLVTLLCQRPAARQWRDLSSSFHASLQLGKPYAISYFQPWRTLVWIGEGAVRNPTIVLVLYPDG